MPGQLKAAENTQRTALRVMDREMDLLEEVAADGYSSSFVRRAAAKLARRLEALARGA